jgi:hypothetical protein
MKGIELKRRKKKKRKKGGACRRQAIAKYQLHIIYLIWFSAKKDD